MKLNRRTALAGAALLPFAGAARAEDFPTKPIKIVVPFAAGSATDLVARGAGASAVATAPADGYTLLMGTNTTNSADGALLKKLPYGPDKDFAPIARCVTGVNALVVNNDLPIRSVAELVEYAKKNPGKLNCSATSASRRLSGEMFNSHPDPGRQGARPRRHRPAAHQGGARPAGDRRGGEGLLAGLLAGRVRAGRDAKPIQQRLFDAIAEAMKDPATVQAMTQGRMEAAVIGLDDFATCVKTETKWWTDAIKAAGIEAE